MTSIRSTTNGRSPAMPGASPVPAADAAVTAEAAETAASGDSAAEPRSLSAIIPTVGRVSLKAAVRSVLRQTFPTTPLVVLDRPDRVDRVRRQLAELSHRLVVTEGAVGAAAARNLGVRSAETTHVAFLDDDDEWVADKAALQMSAVQDEVVVSARSLLVGPTSRVVPEQLYDPGQRTGTGVLDYVLERSTVQLRRRFMQTSSLLCTRRAALQTPWDAALTRHQDWDWAVRLEAAGMRFTMLSDVLVRVHQGSRGSISQRPDWRASSRWIETLPIPVSARARADFLSAVVARGAFASGCWWQGMRHLVSGLRGRPHPAAVLVGLSGIVRAGGHGG